MELKNFLKGLLLIVVILVLLVIFYRLYVYNYCKNNMKCLKERLIFSLGKLEEINKQNKENERHMKHMENKQSNDDEIEGFFGGLSTWFSGSSPTNLPISQGSLGNENLNTLEMKINDKMRTSTKFPPPENELNGNNDDFKDSDNNDLLQNIGTKPYTNKINLAQKVKPIIENKEDVAVFNEPVKIKMDTPSKIKIDSPTPKPNLKSLLGSCQFFNDKCPDKYEPLGNFAIQGVGNGSVLTCGDVQDTKPAHAIAQIKNNAIYEIHVTDGGKGFNPSNPPKITVEGGKGHGATASAVIDDDGVLKLIKLINPGYNYTETPNVLIDAPFMNSSCHLCCKNE